MLNLVASFMRPLIRTLPGKKYLFALLPGSEALWSRVRPSRRVFFDRYLGAYVFADLTWSFSRRYYFYGRYPADGVLLLIEGWLNSGDVFVDVGGHWGIYSLAASRAVGSDGRVFIFEPNPLSAQIIESQLVINGIQNCQLRTVGLSDKNDELNLQMPAGTDTSWCTFRELDGGKNGIKVPVARADHILSDLPDGKHILVKIDTEGFEHQVIRGFGKLRTIKNISFVIEVTDEWLQATGTSAKQLFIEMSQEGFTAYCLQRWRNGLRRGVNLVPISEPANAFQYDVVFSRNPPQAFCK